MAYTKSFLSEILTTKFTDIGSMNDHLRRSYLDRALVISSPIEFWKLMVKNPTNLKESLIFPLQKQFFVLFVFCLSEPMKNEKTKENVLADFDIPKSSLFQNIFWTR